MVDQRRWWTRIVERSMNVRSNALELVVRLVELDVAVAVGAVAGGGGVWGVSGCDGGKNNQDKATVDLHTVDVGISRFGARILPSGGGEGCPVASVGGNWPDDHRV